MTFRTIRKESFGDYYSWAHDRKDELRHKPTNEMDKWAWSMSHGMAIAARQIPVDMDGTVLPMLSLILKRQRAKQEEVNKQMEAVS